MKLIKTYSIIIVCSVILSVFLFIVFKLVIEKKLNPYPSDIIQEYKNKTGNEFDKRPRFKVYEDLIKDNPNVMVSVPPESYLINVNYKIKNNVFPLSGVSNVLTINCNENGYYSTYKSDRYGFNNPDKEWDKKNIEYLLIGDSMVHGFCVNRPNDIASVLRNLSNKAILNLGYGGNGPLLEYATLKEYIRPNVKNVVWVYYEDNDINNLKKELKSKILNQYLVNYNFTQDLKYKQNKVNFTVKDYLNFHYNKIIKLYNSIKQIFVNLINRNSINKEAKNKSEILNKFSNVLNLAKTISVENNSNFYFVYLPGINRYKNTDYKNVFYKDVKKIVEGLEIPFIDIDKEVFQKETHPLKLFPFERYHHYTVEGFRKVTESIFRVVSK
tara:strand:+ start:1102 stop:2253 length:1152 start_codon:yes stop_codon:yes gene_type:complete